MGVRICICGIEAVARTSRGEIDRVEWAHNGKEIGESIFSRYEDSIRDQVEQKEAELWEEQRIARMEGDR